MYKENEWRDTTSYSRSQKQEDREPSVWEFRSGALRLVIVRSWRFPEEPWSYALYGQVQITDGYLNSRDFDSAKQEAILAIESLMGDTKTILEKAKHA